MAMSGSLFGNFGAPLASIASGLFTDASAPYRAAQAPYENYMNRATGAQNPFFNAGTQALPQYQNFLSSMSNPSDFINHLMKSYQASPYSQYLQQQAIRSAQNAGSESGLLGSSPMNQQIQQNATNISSQDMQNWLSNVLGINTQYGAGLQGLVSGGQNSANALSDLFSNQAQGAGNLAYGQEQGRNQNVGNIIGGIFGL